MVARRWCGGGLLLDTDLRTLLGLRLPVGIEEFALDPSGRYLLAPDFFTGRLIVFDLDGNREIDRSRFVGQGTGVVHPLPGNRLILGNDCGLVEVDVTRVLREALVLGENPPERDHAREERP